MAQPQGYGYPPPVENSAPPNQYGGYAPPQQGYPPPQQGYPPPQQGYPPPQAGYPPPQAGYPPPQAGYAPTQPGYAPPINQQPGKCPFLTGFFWPIVFFYTLLIEKSWKTSLFKLVNLL